jgi:hypothetical protein
MSTTIREQILARVEQVLATASATVYAEYEQVPKDAAKGIIAGDFIDDPETNNMIDKHTLDMPMGFFARGATARTVADALQDEVLGKLMNDTTLKGLVRTFKAGPVRGRGEGTGGKSSLISQTFTAIYFTEAGSQTKPAT